MGKGGRSREGKEGEAWGRKLRYGEGWGGTEEGGENFLLPGSHGGEETD